MLLIIPLLVHLVHDMLVKKIVHAISATVTVASAIVLGLAVHTSGDVMWWQFVIFSLSIHFCFFDPIWNLLHKQKWYYNGDPNNPNRALTDRFWDHIPIIARPLVRLWVLGVGAGFYYHLDWIIKGYNG